MVLPLRHLAFIVKHLGFFAMKNKVMVVQFKLYVSANQISLRCYFLYVALCFTSINLVVAFC